MRPRLPAPVNKKIGSGSGAALKAATPGGSGSATLADKIKIIQIRFQDLLNLDPDPLNSRLKKLQTNKTEKKKKVNQTFQELNFHAPIFIIYFNFCLPSLHKVMKVKLNTNNLVS